MSDEPSTTTQKPAPTLSRRQRDLVDEVAFGEATTFEEAARAAGYVGDPARALRGDPALEAEMAGALEIRALVERAASIKRLSSIRDDPNTPVETVILVCKQIASLCADAQPVDQSAELVKRINSAMGPHRRDFASPSVGGEGVLGDVPAIFHGLPQAGEWNSPLVDLGRRRAERESQSRGDAFVFNIEVVERLEGVEMLRVDLMTTPGGTGALGPATVLRAVEFDAPRLQRPNQLWFETKDAPAGDNFARIRIRTTGAPTKGTLKISI